MAITPTYSWPLPDNDDLVKDGAEAIRDLGNAIDTTVGGLPGAGLVHIETQTFSAVSSFSFSNDVFTSAFNNYLILFEASAASADSQNILWRGRVAGSDISTANYNRQSLFASDTTISGARLTGQTSGRFGFVDDESGINVMQAQIFSPKLSKITGFLSSSFQPNSGALISFHGGNFGLTTSFDSISLIISSGTITGKADLYGYKF